MDNLVSFKNNPAYRLVVYTVLATAGTFAVKQCGEHSKLEEITVTAEKPIIIDEHPSDMYDAGVKYRAVLSE